MPPKKPQLSFRPDGTFTIVQFTDTHIADGEENDQQTLSLMAAVLDSEQPDLVVFTGDVIDGRIAKDPAYAYSLATQSLVERQIKWATVFGNHDDEHNLPKTELLELQRKIPYCCTQAGPVSLPGVGNYSLQIRSTHSGKIAASLYCIDSHSYAEASVGGYDWVKDAQIRWLSKELKRLHSDRETQLVPALLFLHIPLQEYEEIWHSGDCRGSKNESICCPRLNTGLFAALRLSGRVQGVFAGHDHTNDFSGDLHGIQLCYGRASGYNTYGKEGFQRGARIIQLREGQRGFTSWIRLHDGQKVL